MYTIKNILLTLILIVVMGSCSKEENEIPLADPGVSISDFDSGFIGIALEGANTFVDSIIYTNITKGASFHIAPSFINFTQSLDTGLLYRPLYNGNTGDEVECCVYLNTATMLGISFVKDTILLDAKPAGVFCQIGTY